MEFEKFDWTPKKSSDKLENTGFQIEEIVKGINAMQAALGKVVIGIENVGKTSEKETKKEVSRLRKYTRVAEVAGPFPTFAKGWIAFRRLTSRMAPDLWQIQNALVGIFDTIQTGFKLYDKLVGENVDGEKQSLMVRIQERFEMRDKIKLLQEERGLTSDIVKNNSESVAQLMYAREEHARIEKLLESTDTFLEDGSVNPEYQKLLDQRKKVIKDAGEAQSTLDAERNRRMEIGGTRYKLEKGKENIQKFWNKMKPKDLAKTMSTVGRMALGFLKFFAMFIAIGAAFILFAKQVEIGKLLLGIWDAVKLVWDAISAGLDLVWNGLVLLWDGLSEIWEGLNQFLSGDTAGLTKIWDGLWTAGEGLFNIIVGLLATAVMSTFGAVIIFIKEFFSSYYERLVNGSDDIRDKLAAVWKIVVAVGTIAVAIAFIASMSWVPLLITLLVGALLAALPNFITGRASGGMANGLTLVGEKGPELVNLPAGSRVYSNNQSKSMVGNTNNITVNVQGRIGASDAELKEIAQKIGQMINIEINRTTSTRTRGI